MQAPITTKQTVVTSRRQAAWAYITCACCPPAAYALTATGQSWGRAGAGMVAMVKSGLLMLAMVETVVAVG